MVVCRPVAMHTLRDEPCWCALYRMPKKATSKPKNQPKTKSKLRSLQQAAGHLLQAGTGMGRRRICHYRQKAAGHLLESYMYRQARSSRLNDLTVNVLL